MENITLFEEFQFLRKAGKAVIDAIKPSPMTKEDDISSDFPYLIKKAFDNKCLYIDLLYGNIKTKEFIGVNYIIPYSDGKDRDIKIYIRENEGVATVTDGPRNRMTGETDDIETYKQLLDYITPLLDTEFNKDQHYKEIHNQ